MGGRGRHIGERLSIGVRTRDPREWHLDQGFPGWGCRERPAQDCKITKSYLTITVATTQGFETRLRDGKTMNAAHRRVSRTNMTDCWGPHSWVPTPAACTPPLSFRFPPTESHTTVGEDHHCPSLPACPSHTDPECRTSRSSKFPNRPPAAPLSESPTPEHLLAAVDTRPQPKLILPVIAEGLLGDDVVNCCGY